MKLCYLFVIASLAMLAADDPYAEQLFQKHCASCHDSEAGAGGRSPQRSVLKTMTPAAIQKTLESGVMKAQAAPLSADERLKVAALLGTAVTVERKREEIANPCLSSAVWGSGPAWASWGGGLANARFQSAKDAGLRAEDLPRLKLKWTFAFADTSTLRSQPAVYRGRVFAGGQDGSVYALDAATGCVCIGPRLCQPRSVPALRWARSAANPRYSSAIRPATYMRWTPPVANNCGKCAPTNILLRP